MAVGGLEELLDVPPRALELRGIRRRQAPDHPQPPAGAPARAPGGILQFNLIPITGREVSNRNKPTQPKAQSKLSKKSNRTREKREGNGRRRSPVRVEQEGKEAAAAAAATARRVDGEGEAGRREAEAAARRSAMAVAGFGIFGEEDGWSAALD